MTSFNTVTYPSQESNVTNVNGNLVFYTGDVIIIYYHVHPAARVASPIVVICIQVSALHSCAWCRICANRVLHWRRHS